MKKMLLIISTIVLISTLAFTQSMLLDAGQSGYSISSNYHSTEDVSGFGASFHYASNGTFDFGASYGTSSYKDDTDMAAKGLSAGGSFHFLKQSETMPVSVAVSGVYSKITFESDDLDYLDWDMYGSQTVFGGFIYRRLSNSQGLNLIPNVGYFIGKSKVTIEDSYGDSESVDEEENYFGVGCALLFNNAGPNKFFIEPSLLIYDEVNQFNITVGMLITN